MRRADEADIVAAAVTSTAIGIVVVVFEVISRGATSPVLVAKGASAAILIFLS